MANFTKARKTFTEALTFSRALGTFEPAADGLFNAVGTNEPRFSVGNLEPVVPSGNVVAHPRDMTNAAWDSFGTGTCTRTGVGITFERNSACVLSDTGSGALYAVEQWLEIPTTNQTNVASVFIGKTVGATTYPAVSFQYANLASDWCLNTNTGVATRITAAGYDGACSIEDHGPFWRVIITLQNTTASPDAVLTIYPAFNATGGATYNNSTTGSCVVDFCTVELGLSAPSAVSTVLTGGGLAIESGSTNLLLYCRDLTNAAWDPEATITRTKNAVGIDGVANSATTLNDTDGTYNSHVRQEVTLAAVNQPCVGSCFFGKTGTAQYPALGFQITGGGSEIVMINAMTGAIASTFGGAPAATVEDYGDFWRVSITITNSASSTFGALDIHPALASGAATGSIIADFAMIEQGRSTASSPISTTTATVTRPSESAVNALFSTWGRQQFFTMLVEIEDFQMTPAGGDILSLYKTGTDRIRISSDPGSGGRFAIHSAMDTGGTKTRYFTATSSAKIAISSSGYSASDGVIKAVNGASLTDDFTSAVYSDITSLGIGRGQATTNPPQSMTIKRIEFWPKASTAAELEALTAL